MKAKKIFSSLVLLFKTPFKLLKKSKIDNFVGGLIFGALFSLLVNVVTVRLQENINKQRYLEALERELVFQVLTAVNVQRETTRILEESDDNYVSIDNLLRIRYSTRVWDSDYLQPYIFELEPSTGAKINSYYDAIVRSANLQLDKNVESFDKIYDKCLPLRELIEGQERESKAYCNEVARNTALLHEKAGFTDLIVEYVGDVRKDFHPTQDRLNSWWMRLLLGSEAYEVMKIEEGQ